MNAMSNQMKTLTSKHSMALPFSSFLDTSSPSKSTSSTTLLALCLSLLESFSISPSTSANLSFIMSCTYHVKSDEEIVKEGRKVRKRAMKKKSRRGRRDEHEE